MGMGITRTSKRRAFAESREDCSDSKFLEQLGVPPASHSLALCLRRILATQCGIASEKIHVTDPPGRLQPLLSEFFDEAVFLIDVEKMLGRSINMEIQNLPQLFDQRCFWWKRPGASTCGEWIREFIRQINLYDFHTAQHEHS
jgi:hypothetical protein